MGKKLLDIMKDKIRFKPYSISTEKAYVHWVFSAIVIIFTCKDFFHAKDAKIVLKR
jgi:hypothetical protein